MSSYLVPGEVSAAVTTRRPELLNPLRRAVNANGGLNAQDSLALLNLVRDAILGAQNDDERHRVLVNRIETLRGNMKGVLRAFDTLVAEATGGPVREDDDD